MTGNVWGCVVGSVSHVGGGSVETAVYTRGASDMIGSVLMEMMVDLRIRVMIVPVLEGCCGTLLLTQNEIAEVKERVLGMC